MSNDHRKLARLRRQFTRAGELYCAAMAASQAALWMNDESLPDGPQTPELRKVHNVLAAMLERAKRRRMRALWLGTMAESHLRAIGEKPPDFN